MYVLLIMYVLYLTPVLSNYKKYVSLNQTVSSGDTLSLIGALIYHDLRLHVNNPQGAHYCKHVLTFSRYC